MKVIATQFGFYGGVRRREGSTFDVKPGETAEWFTPVDGKPDVEKARAEIKAKADAKTKAQGDGVAKAKSDAVDKAKAEADAKAKADADDLV